MAVTLFSERWESRETDHDGRTGITTHKRGFRVRVNSKNDDGQAILDYGAVNLGLQIGTLHPSGSGWLIKGRAKCSSVDWTDWEVDYDYTTFEEKNEDPQFDPAKCEWDTEQFQEPFFHAVNSAGDPFDPPAQRDNSRRTVVVKKNLLAVPSWILDFQDAVNVSAFTVDGFTVPKGLAKMQRVSLSDWQVRNGIPYRTVTMVIHLNKNGWKARYLDAGFRQIDPKNPNKRIKIVNDDGTEPSNPVLLDGEGKVLNPPSFEGAVFLEYEKYVEADFNVLPLT